MKLTPEKIEECAQWVRENGLTEYGGATIVKFCTAQGINKITYYRWLENETFATAIKEAQAAFKDNLELELVVSLAKTAKGYTYIKRKTEMRPDAEGEPMIVKQTSEDIEVQPNVGAAIFLLTNINPEKWKNKISNDVNANVKGEIETEKTYDFADIPEEQLLALADKLQDGLFQRKKAEKQ